MKTLLATVSILLTGTCAVVVATLLVELKENRELRRENQKLWADLQTTKTQAQDLEEEKSEATTKLAAKHDELQALEAKLGKAETEAENAKTNGTPANGQVFRPYQLRAFLGNRFVGRAWIVPSNVTKDPKTGRINFEPVAVLEEASKKAFTVQETNVVERDVVRYSSVNYNYNPYPYSWYYYPLATVGTNVPPVMPPNNTPTPSTPVSVRPLVSGGGPWTPFIIERSRPPTPAQGSGNRNVGRNMQPLPSVPSVQAVGTVRPVPIQR